MALPGSVRAYLDEHGFDYHVDDDEPPEALIVKVDAGGAEELGAFLDTLPEVACALTVSGELCIYDPREITDPGS